MNQKGFANIALIVLVVILASALGYVTLVKKPAPVERPQANNLQNTQQPTAPKLTPYDATHFTIGLPEGWAVGTATESGDAVSFRNPKEPNAYVAVYTFEAAPNLEGRWQFSGRNAVSFKGNDGREGIVAEGPYVLDPTQQILAVGYHVTGNYLLYTRNRVGNSWDVIAHAVAPKEQFETMKPLFTAILKSLKLEE